MSGPAYAFDILTQADGSDTGWLMAADTLYRVDLATGMSASVGTVSG